MREALADWLQAAGYGVRTAAERQCGLAAVTAAPPALVVTDIHMPGMNGRHGDLGTETAPPPGCHHCDIGSVQFRHGLDARLPSRSARLGRWPSRSSAPSCCVPWRSSSGARPLAGDAAGDNCREQPLSHHPGKLPSTP